MESLDKELAKLRRSAMLGPDAELWQAVEKHDGVVYNMGDRISYYCFSKSTTTGEGYVTKPNIIWQEAAKDFLAWATFGVKNNGANKS